MFKKILLGGLSVLVLLGAGCQKPNNNSANQNVVEDKNFSDKNTSVTFLLPENLKAEVVSSEPGAVIEKISKKNSDSLLENVIFSTKTRDAWLNEMVKARLQNPNQTCQNEMQFGCEKWDEDKATYLKAVNNNDFSGYYALGTDKVTINNVPFVVAVTFNTDAQQFQTMYVAYVSNTRVTFIDPATGGLEYGIPFQMDAKNRELVETTAKKLATRQKVDDPKTRARADQLFQLVSTVKVK